MLKKLISKDNVKRPLDYSLSNFTEVFFQKQTGERKLLSWHKTKKNCSKLALPANCVAQFASESNDRIYTGIAYEIAPVLGALLLGRDKVPKVENATDFREYVSTIFEHLEEDALPPVLKADPRYRYLGLTEAFAKDFSQKVATVLTIALSEPGDGRVDFLQQILNALDQISAKYLLDHPDFSVGGQGIPCEINAMLQTFFKTLAPESSDYLKLDEGVPCYEKIASYVKSFNEVYKVYHTKKTVKPCLDKLREEARSAYRDYLHNKHVVAEGKTAPPPLQILIDQMNQGISDEAYGAKLIDYLMLSMLDPTDGVPLKRNSLTALLDLIATGIDTYEQEYLNQTLAEFAGEGLPIYKHIQNIYASMQYMGMFPPQTSYGISYQNPDAIAEWLRRIEFWKNEIRHISSRDLFDTSTFLPTNQEDVESYLERMLTGFEPYDIKVANGEIHLISYAIIQWGTQIELFNGVEGIADTPTVFQREMNTLKTSIIWAEIGQGANFLTGLQLLTYAALKEVAVRHACAFMDKRAKNRSRLQELKDKIVEKDAYREISQKLSDTIYEFIYEQYPKEDKEVFNDI